MNISNPVKIVNRANGKIPKNPTIIVRAASTFNTICPAIIFAASLIERLMGRAKYANNSIIISSGAMKIGTPFGKNSDKK